MVWLSHNELIVLPIFIEMICVDQIWLTLNFISLTSSDI